VATHSSWQALPPLKTVPVQNAQFNNIGVIKNGDIFHYQNSDAVNAFGVIERFGNGIVMFDKRYFTTANFVKITVQPKPAPKPKTSSTIKNPPSVPGGFLSKLWNSIVLSFYLLFSRLFAVISWVVTKAVTAVAKAVERTQEGDQSGDGGLHRFSPLVFPFLSLHFFGSYALC
jgi:hypothetical protein